jgi:hypothetical protein
MVGMLRPPCSRACFGAVLLLSMPLALSAQKDTRSGYDRAARATVLHPAVVYVAADDDAQKISLVLPGHEVVVTERNGPWVKVFANADLKEKTNDSEEPLIADEDNVAPAAGWIRNKGVVNPQTPNGSEPGGSGGTTACASRCGERGASAVCARCRLLSRLGAGGGSGMARGGYSLADREAGQQHAAFGQGTGSVSAAADLRRQHEEDPEAVSGNAVCGARGV